MSWDFYADTTIDRAVLDKIWDRITRYIEAHYSNVFTKNIEFDFGGFVLGITPRGKSYIGNTVASFITGEGLTTRIKELEQENKRKSDAGIPVVIKRLKENSKSEYYYYEVVEYFVRNWQNVKQAIEHETVFYKNFEL